MLKKDKPKEVEKLKNLIESYSVVGILDMHKIPARQLQQIRDKLRGKAVIRMTTKNIIIRALSSSNKKDLAKLKEKITNEPALILSNENPFKLYKILKENKTNAAAKMGDIAPNDIIVKKGPTGIQAGPAISAFQKLGLKTTVQQGKIEIVQDKVVAKQGDEITEEMVNLFNMLKMEPMEIMLNLPAAWEDGIIYEKEVLDIDQTEYINNIQTCVRHAVNLSVNIDYPTKLTIDMMISRSFHEMKQLCLECDILEKEFADEILEKAIRQAKALESSLPLKNQKEENPSENNASDNNGGVKQ